MKTLPIFAILFLGIPIIEIYFLIQVGSSIGALATIFLVVATAVIGAFLLRQQGLSTLQRFQKNSAAGKIPAQELIEGVILIVGGALLMTPGFFTDTIGFLCLLPFSRKAIALWFMRHSATKVKNHFHHKFSEQTQQNTRASSSNSNVYEGEYTKKSDDRIEKW